MRGLQVHAETVDAGELELTGYGAKLTVQLHTCFSEGRLTERGLSLTVG